MIKNNYNLNSFKKFYKNKKIFITGHTGFKGSWLTFIMLKLGANVKGYSLPPDKNNPSNFKLLNLDKKIHNFYGDIRNFEHLKKEIYDFKPEIIFHLAAQPIVANAFENPRYTLDVNFMGSVNMLEIARSSDFLKSFIFVTSDKCYENNEWPWGYRETDELGGSDPYSASKSSCELIYSSYSRSYFKHKKNFTSASVRAGNVIGGGDWSNFRIVPDIIKAIEEKKNIKIRSPLSTRPWQHVLEPLCGYMSLPIFMKKNMLHESWNFGPNSESIQNVSQLANFICEFFRHKKINMNIQKKMNINESKILKLNSDKANFYLNWNARWNLNQCLLKTCEWYDHYFDNKDMSSITEKQIIEYFG